MGIIIHRINAPFPVYDALNEKFKLPDRIFKLGDDISILALSTRSPSANSHFSFYKINPSSTYGTICFPVHLMFPCIHGFVRTKVTNISLPFLLICCGSNNFPSESVHGASFFQSNQAIFISSFID